MKPPDEKKEKILKVAKNFFSRFGLKKTTMEDIARKLRMGKSTLYYYFRNKEEIFAAVIQKETSSLKKILEEVVSSQVSPQKKLEAYVLTRMRYLKNLQDYYSTITDDYLEYYPFLERERETFTRYEIKSIENIFREGIEKGIFLIQDVEETATVFTIAMKGLEYPFLREKWGESEEEMEKRVKRMLGLLFKGIEKRG